MRSKGVPHSNLLKNKTAVQMINFNQWKASRGKQVNIAMPFKTRVVFELCSCHPRPHEVVRGRFAPSVLTTSRVHQLIWEYITSYWITIMSLQCMPPSLIPHSVERPRPDMSHAVCRSVALNSQGFLFAVWFVGFDLLQIHCELNHFCKEND